MRRTGGLFLALFLAFPPLASAPQEPAQGEADSPAATPVRLVGTVAADGTSDVVAGVVLGVAVGRGLSRRHAAGRQGLDFFPFVTVDGSVAVAAGVRF